MKTTRIASTAFVAASLVALFIWLLAVEFNSVGAMQHLAYAVTLILTVLVPVLTIGTSLVRGNPVDLLSPFVLVPLTIGIVYGGAPSLLYAQGLDGTAEQVTKALAVGIVGYYCGAVPLYLSQPQPSRTYDRAEFSEAPYRKIVLVAAFAVGVVSMLVYWIRAGGIPILSGDLENSRLSALTGSGTPFYLSMLMMVSYWLMLRPGAQFTFLEKLVYFVVALILLGSTGWRNTVFAFIAISLLSAHYVKPIRLGKLAFATGATVVLAIVIGIYRVYSSKLTAYAAYQQIAAGDYVGGAGTYLSTYFDAFGRNLGTVLQLVPDSMEFQHGKTLVWNFLSLLPGSDLKPFDFELKRVAGQGFAGGGLPPTLVGEFFINFSWPGILIGMALVGMVSAGAHSVLVRPHNYRSLLISVILAYYMFVAVRGGIGNVLLTLSWLAFATFIISHLAEQPRASVGTTMPTHRRVHHAT